MDIGNPFPASTIMYASSDATGANWSVPAPVASLADAATDLRLVANNATIGLVYLHTPDGPLATRFSMKAVNWTGSAWNASPTVLLDNASVNGFDATAGNTNATTPAVIVYSDHTGNLTGYTWSGAVTNGPTLVGTNLTGSVDLVANAANQFFAASRHRDGGINLFRFDTTNGWLNFGVVFSNAAPSEIHLTPLPDTDTTVYLLTWTEGERPSDIWYGFTDGTGIPLKGPLKLTYNSVGKYSDIHLLPQAGKTTKVIARYEDISTSVVQLDVALAGIRPRLEQFSLLSGAGFAFRLTGDNSLDYRIQGAADLANWTTLTNVGGTNLPYFFIDPAALGLPHRFYRAVSP